MYIERVLNSVYCKAHALPMYITLTRGMQLFFNVYFNLQHFLNKLLHQRVHVHSRIKYAVSRKGIIRCMHPLDYMQCVYDEQYDENDIN